MGNGREAWLDNYLFNDCTLRSKDENVSFSNETVAQKI